MSALPTDRAAAAAQSNPQAVSSKADIPSAELASLVRAGRKVGCPVCGRRVMSQSYASFYSSGIGQHIRQSHPELESAVLAASRQMERQHRAAEEAVEREARERPLRAHLFTGAEIDEIIQELGSLIGMMEPYWSQGSGADSALELIDRLEARASQGEE